MEFRQLRYFLAVADAGHITRAAAHLGMAQPPLSQQIQALEAELGVALFERSRRHVTLTAAGERLLERARALLREAGAAAEEVRRIGRGELGELRIAFTSSLPFSELIPRLLYDYRRRYPDVRLELRDTGTQRQLDLLLAGRAGPQPGRQQPRDERWLEPHRSRNRHQRSSRRAGLPASPRRRCTAAYRGVGSNPVHDIAGVHGNSPCRERRQRL